MSSENLFSVIGESTTNFNLSAVRERSEFIWVGGGGASIQCTEFRGGGGWGHDTLNWGGGHITVHSYRGGGHFTVFPFLPIFTHFLSRCLPKMLAHVRTHNTTSSLYNYSFKKGTNKKIIPLHNFCLPGTVNPHTLEYIYFIGRLFHSYTVKYKRDCT